ncbi:MAG: mucoidy inhibitor MuiA family protein [Byssovorax sp.]
MLQIECESRIERVVVYARGAVVTRHVTLPEALPDGPVELCLAGITALAEAGSVRALARGEREVTAIKAQVAIPGASTKPGRLREQVRALELERARIDAEAAYVLRRRQALIGVSPEPQFARWSAHADPAARFHDALALGGLIGAEVRALHERSRDLDAAREENQRRLSAASIAARQGTTAELDGEPRAELGVRVRIGGGSGALSLLEIDYVVTAARWWPSYTARLSAAATRVSLGLDAFVAQASGEAWSGVKLGISTADLASDVRLPELRSLRIGRAQAAPRKGYRPPPAGLEAMFEGHDRAVNQGDLEHEEEEDEDAVMAQCIDVPDGGGGFPQQQGYGAPPPMAAPGGSSSSMLMSLSAVMAAPMPQAIPSSASAFAPARTKSGGLGGMMRRAMSESNDMPARAEGARSFGAVAPPPEPAAPLPIEPDEAWLDFDALTIGDPLDAQNRGRRGRLARDPASAYGSRAAVARATIDALGSPPDARDPLETRGRFDHRYDAEGTADVPSSATPHRVTIGSAEGEARPRFVAVPREAAEVYREAEIPNPFAAPLLSGPVEVFVDGALLTTSSLDFVDRGKVLRLGLGVEERLRVARNARVEEGSAGLLGGSTTIDHHVTIDVASSLGHPAAIEVIDRVPVTNDKDLEIKLVSFKPAAAKLPPSDHREPVRGGLSWNITVSPGEKQRIELTYRVTIPAKNELVGGNRRE